MHYIVQDMQKEPQQEYESCVCEACAHFSFVGDNYYRKGTSVRYVLRERRGRLSSL